MHIDRIYIQDNFVPDIVTDQFRRKVIGVSVCLKEGEGTLEAEQYAEQFIKEYIQKNTVDPQVSGISMVADNHSVPEVQLEKPKQTTLEEDIMSSPSLNVLQSYRIIVKNKPDLQVIYDTKLKEFQP